MLAYLISSTVVSGFLALVWNRSSKVNLLIKGVLIGITVWGIVLTLMTLGYVVKS